MAAKADSTRAPDGATAFTTTASILGPDADLIAAFERRHTARMAIMALPDGSDDEATKLDEETAMLETFVQLALAQTVRGAEVQLWVALSSLVSDYEQDVRTYSADIAYFNGIEKTLDWPARLVVSAINSMRSMRDGGAA